MSPFSAADDIYKKEVDLFEFRSSTLKKKNKKNKNKKRSSILKYNRLIILLPRESISVNYIFVVMAVVSKKGRNFSKY